MCWASPLTDVLNPHRVVTSPRSAFNYSLLIANCSFPQGYVNPPIRGSIARHYAWYTWGISINPPIRGSIARHYAWYTWGISINPPIRGSIARGYEYLVVTPMYQSPYKGFNSDELMLFASRFNSLNPPIRGSIGAGYGAPTETIWYQSPYKGFNSYEVEFSAMLTEDGVSIPL